MGLREAREQFRVTGRTPWQYKIYDKNSPFWILVILIVVAIFAVQFVINYKPGDQIGWTTEDIRSTHVIAKQQVAPTAVPAPKGPQPTPLYKKRPCSMQSLFC